MTSPIAINHRPSPPSRVHRTLVILAVWTVFAAFWATRWWIIYRGTPTPMLWWESFSLSLVEWYLWALASIFIFRLCGRRPLTAENWKRTVVIHGAVAFPLASLMLLVYTFAHIPIDNWFMDKPLFYTESSVWTSVFFIWKTKTHMGIIVYALICFMSYASAYYTRYRQEELRASQLREELASSQLQALRSQLHPHFLFNTLNAIASLVRENPNAAERMLTRLSDLLRLTLRNQSKHTVALSQEITFIESYLEIERVRFSDRLATEIDINPETQNAEVPYLILQPLVENAVRHGISPTSKGGTIRVISRRVGDRLTLEVSDDGVGLAAPKTGMTPSESQDAGLGLANTRARLERLYPSNHEFSITSGVAGGVTVRIDIPFIVESAARPIAN